MGATPQKRKRWRSRSAKQTKFKIFLNDQFAIPVEYWSKGGKIIRFAAVLIREKDDRGGHHQICRYDSAHDFAHLDVLDHEGRVMNKVAIPGNPKYEEAVDYAISDLKKNCQTYWEKFRSRKDKVSAKAS